MTEERRTWLPIGLAAGFALTGVVAVLATAQFNQPVSAPTCATSVKASSPFVPPARFDEDGNLAALGGAVEEMTAPFGPVRAGVGYNYDQWLHLYGVNGGLLTFTKDNAPLTLLDDRTLKPRWALNPATKRIAWDASDNSLLLLDLAAGKPTRIGRYNLRDGTEDWCVNLPSRHRDGEPVATAFVAPDADVVVALPENNGAIQLSRLAVGTGRAVWTEKLTGVDRADFLGTFVNDQVIIGGTEAFRLAQLDPNLKERQVLRAIDLAEGSTRWTWQAPSGTRAHVVGTSGETLIVQTRSAAGSVLLGLDPDGRELWRRKPVPESLDVTSRAGLVLTRSKTELSAYNATDGRPYWRRPIPTDRTYIPYGFTLNQMPSLDDERLLVPTTTSLLVFALADGSGEELPLPTDGVSTTYWPYQLVSTKSLLAVVTNTGAVVADRDVAALR